MQLNKVHHLNFLDNTLPDKCAQLIIADPPYFEVKGEFDFIWSSFEAYLQDVEKWAIECKRLLADNGTLFWWGHAKKLAYTQVIIDKHLNLLSAPVWKKTECQTMKSEISALRTFAPITERLLMYDHGEDMSGNERIFDDPSLFSELKIFFDTWLRESGMTLKEATEKIGSSCTHWFGFSERIKKQFAIPTKEKWDRMNQIHHINIPYKDILIKYEDMRKEYEHLRLQYEDLRRHFKLPFMISDVLEYSQQTHLTGQYDHETKNPPGLTRMLINVCSKPGDLVLVPFAGSGTECEAAAAEGREFVGFDINEKHVNTSNTRAIKRLNTPMLFY